jgi:HEPN domain-containing protein
VTGRSLAKSYVAKATVRVRVLSHYLDAADYSDAVREAQEAVELALKAALRFIGVEPPRIHDVGALLREYADRLAGLDVERLAAVSRGLGKERELASCGDLDYLPTEQYTRREAEQAIADATYAVTAVEAWMRARPTP